MTLVQHAGTTRTVSGPAALSTYRSASESLQPAHADVHFSTYSSLGISAIVFNSCSDIKWTGRREKRSRNYHYLLSTVHEKSIISFPITGVYKRHLFLLLSHRPVMCLKAHLINKVYWGGTNPCVDSALNSSLLPPSKTLEKPTLQFLFSFIVTFSPETSSASCYIS